MTNGQSEPPTWTPEQLQAGAIRATQEFVRERLNEPSKKYEELYLAQRKRIEWLAELSAEFTDLAPEPLLQDKSWLDEFRYLAGPPISADDMRTIVGSRLGKKKVSAAEARSIVDTVVSALDPFRFPWVAAARQPTASELGTAVSWTAGLMAIEQLRTDRRISASVDQEALVKAVLRSEGFQAVPRPGIEMQTLDELDRGCFTDELKLAGQKADVPIRLRDGRMLAVECKVSNSAVNSIKRLINDAGSKADSWKAAFGKQVIPCAVISGVYDVSTLINAQAQKGLFLIWQHDLTPLAEFVRRAG